jgi:hypothetical protein
MTMPPLPPSRRQNRMQEEDDDHFDQESEDSDEDFDEDISLEHDGTDAGIDFNWDEGMTEEEAHQAYEDRFERFLEAQRERDNGLATSTFLTDFEWMTPGSIVQVEYDYGTTTYFKVRLDSIRLESNGSIVFPLLLPSKAKEAAKDFELYQPPSGSRNVDDVYPLANNIMFASWISKWVCPYPTSPTSAGFVEGGKNFGSDIVFLPVPHESLHQALVAIDVAMKKFPKPKGVSRMMFPIKLDA